MTDFATNLRTLRLKNNIRQQTIADALGINRTTYTHWELGDAEPKISTIIKLAEMLNVDCHFLLTGESAESAH